MMPTQFMFTAVSMLPNTLPQLSYLCDQLIPRHFSKIFIHEAPPVAALMHNELAANAGHEPLPKAGARNERTL